MSLVLLRIKINLFLWKGVMGFFLLLFFNGTCLRHSLLIISHINVVGHLVGACVMEECQFIDWRDEDRLGQ